MAKLIRMLEQMKLEGPLEVMNLAGSFKAGETCRDHLKLMKLIVLELCGEEMIK